MNLQIAQSAGAVTDQWQLSTVGGQRGGGTNPVLVPAVSLAPNKAKGFIEIYVMFVIKFIVSCLVLQ